MPRRCVMLVSYCFVMFVLSSFPLSSSVVTFNYSLDSDLQVVVESSSHLFYQNITLTKLLNL